METWHAHAQLGNREWSVDECFSILQFEPSLFCLMTGRLVSKSFHEASLLLEFRLKFTSRKELFDFIKLVDRKFIRRVVEINAKRCDIEDDDLEIIGSSFDNLKFLNLKGNHISVYGISMIEKCHIADTLERLYITAENVSVRSFKNLKFLSCNNIVETSKQVHQLESLHNSEPNIQHLQNLKHIRLTGAKNSIWNPLNNISTLEGLSLCRYNEHLSTNKIYLSVFKKLKKLSIKNSSITLEEIETIAKNLDLIECLKLVRVTSQGNLMVDILTDLKVIERLDTLDLCNNNITDKGIEYLLSKANPEKLTSLSLSSLEITEKGVSLIAECQKLRNLKSLTLHELKDYVSLEHLMNGRFLNLECLDITGYRGPIKPLDDFFQSPFAKRLTRGKHFKGYTVQHTFSRDTVILKTNPVNVESLLQFMVNGKYTDNTPTNFSADNESIREETQNFRVQLLCIDNILPHHLGFAMSNFLLEIRADICYGTKTIIERCPHPLTFDYSKTYNHNCYFNFSKRLTELPFESVVKITLSILDLSLMRKKQASQAILPVFDKDRRHTFGIVYQNMCSIIEESPKFGIDMSIVASFDRYNDTVLPFKGYMNELIENLPLKKLPIAELMTKRVLTDEEKSIIWSRRQNIPKTHLGLKKLMESVPFMCFNSINFMRNYVKDISNSFKTPYQYLELLGESFIDTEIRQIAYNVLNELTDAKFLKSIEILVELLRFELHLENPLSKLLLRRSLGNIDIGRRLFWCIQGNLHIDYLREKLKWIAVLFLNGLSNCNFLEFYNQCLYIYQLVEIDSSAKQNLIEFDKYEALLSESVSKIELPNPFILPYPPYRTVQNIVTQKTTISTSRKRLLIVTYKSDGITNQFVLLTQDNRIDNFTTSVLRILSDICNDTSQNEDYNFVQPTSIVPLGSDLYLCEKDYRAKTLSKLQSTHFKPPNFWIEQASNQCPKYEENLVRSYAFCAVIVKVLHIDDMHNDNIIIDEEGNMFLYDKNYILGNPKRKFGLRRKDNFIGGLGLSKLLQSDTFKKLAAWNFHLLSQHSRLLYALFGEMLEFDWDYKNFVSHTELCTIFKNTLEEKETIEECTEMVEYFISESGSLSQVSDFIHFLRHD